MLQGEECLALVDLKRRVDDHDSQLRGIDIAVTRISEQVKNVSEKVDAIRSDMKDDRDEIKKALTIANELQINNNAKEDFSIKNKENSISSLLLQAFKKGVETVIILIFIGALYLVSTKTNLFNK